MVGKAALRLLGEDRFPVHQHIELAVATLLDRGLVIRLGVQLGRETRGPFVIAVSDRAVLNQNVRHDGNLPAVANVAIV